MVTEGKVHHGHNVKRFRLMRGWSQEKFAEKIHLTPSALSRYEQKEVIEDDMLSKMANELHFPIEAIRDLPEDTAMNFIANTFENMSLGALGGNNNIYTINSIEKIFELFAEKDKLHNENVKLYKEKIALYERLLKAEGKISSDQKSINK